MQMLAQLPNIKPHIYVSDTGQVKCDFINNFHKTVIQNFELFNFFFSSYYTATACYGNDVSQFPSSNLFASAGEGIWDNGAACGRQYLVRCISAAQPRTCKPGQTIQIKIVDRALTSVSRPSRNGATMVLSTTAFGMIANPSASFINIEFQQ